MAMHLPPLRLLRPLTTGLLATCAALAAAVATVPSRPQPYDHIVLVTLRLPLQTTLTSLDPASDLQPLPFLTELADDTRHAARLLPKADKEGEPAVLPPRINPDDLAALLQGAGKSLTRAMTSVPMAADFERLPTVTLATPDGVASSTLTQTDLWLRQHIGTYARWATVNNSLLIVLLDSVSSSAKTAPDGDSLPHQPVAALLYGAHVQPGLQRSGVDTHGVLASVLHNQGLLGTLRKQIASRCKAEQSDCDQLLGLWHPTLGML
ncbi:MAG: hypothetical protein RLY71_1137 [Pseudomonadota bacterium]|jgi:hypothetical protein